MKIRAFSGHIHQASDNQYWGTRLIVNSVGYMGEECDYHTGVFDV
jgi:hypothetical protein